MFSEDRIPPCRYEGHPRGYDRRAYMKPAEKDDHVVWACLLCSDIYKTPILQIQVLPRGRERARYFGRGNKR